MRFAEVTGHGALKSMLARGVDEGRVSHAQLFTGQAGYGTLPLALAYAQYVNCTARSGGDSCGVCPSCVKIAALAHPDLHFVYPVNSHKGSKSSSKPGSDAFLTQWRELWASTGGVFGEEAWYRAIGIDNQQGLITRAEADEVIRKLSFKPFEAAYKVMIIWLPERMRTEAANTLLKILEEPWERTLFLLVSESPALLLPTILSRVQEVSVAAVEREDTEGWLRANTALTGEGLGAVARLSGGDLIEASRLAAGEGAEAEGERFEMFASLMRFSYNDRHMELLDWGDQAAAMGREEQKRFLHYAVRMLRESYMLGAGMDEITYIWGAELDFCRRFAPFVGNHNIEGLVAAMEGAAEQIARNGNPRMIFPHLALVVSKLIVKV